MPTLLIVEDRAQMRGTVTKLVEHYLPDGWRPLVIAPLPDVKDYPEYIVNEDVAVLLVDERFNDGGGPAVGYAGHDIAEEVRRRFKQFPVFSWTAYVGEDDVEAAEYTLDGVLDKSQFNAKADAFVPRLVRAGQRWFSETARVLCRIEELSHRVAANAATQSELDELEGLRRAVTLRHAPPVDASFERLQTDVDRLLDEAEKIRSDLEGSSQS